MTVDDSKKEEEEECIIRELEDLNNAFEALGKLYFFNRIEKEIKCFPLTERLQLHSEREEIFSVTYKLFFKYMLQILQEIQSEKDE